MRVGKMDDEMKSSSMEELMKKTMRWVDNLMVNMLNSDRKYFDKRLTMISMTKVIDRYCFGRTDWLIQACRSRMFVLKFFFSSLNEWVASKFQWEAMRINEGRFPYASLETTNSKSN